MTEQLDRRADLTRLQILQAASRQFARTPYSLVSLDDILADAQVTKGALYFHFRSKHALACAIVEYHAAQARDTTEDVAARNLSGLETLIDISYQLAVDDVSDPMTRAGLNLIESIGRTENLGAKVVTDWVARFSAIGRRAVSEGDLTPDSDPDVVARLLVSLYLGVRQTSELEDPQRFLQDLERSWQLVLPGIANPDRLGYLRQFIRRRTTLTARKAVPLHPEPPAHTRAGSA
ncbi:TetR/AcrR family transcriptional regulator [Mycolicibacterium smegmatis]|uniref:Transcriptional regulator, TetR family protein n=1 Tax=Mycolicibacterium smegmatis (strain ATCC 700084 / mc(2)155) TaxID=246196 RepID=A0QUG1_MYCS2|nr:TetR/AcrR family transcriptional regulator [Mycolicibacterium smegmatis]ABK72055.1 transcriptional regulator, TetR family protein [Mycolicibacterium smegmatis MC2 155]AIU07392.1 TetR family transcriptional regulator [Mycolicibacterium smegmatis MC2 155]AIU14017.1 TetR family transcriptional regulator [Mycolicibacterium smegmatis]AIU20640.1 TetR family transcriptional regulator [Mycolicibacterium smegmatis]MBE9619991.1 TetR/AcrR family transcriptional regulator [Mycolicibacterium smegmatis]